MNIRRALTPMLAATGLIYAGGTSALDLRLDGFGTFGLVHSSEENADFVSSSLVPEGAGHSSQGWGSKKVDSRLGLQATMDVTPRISGVVQIIAEQRHDGTARPAVEWANLGYDITPNLNIRAGRLVLPIYMNSQHRKVSYINPWIRPPQEVYSLNPVTSADGVDISYQSRFGGVINTVNLMYGGTDARVPNAGKIEARDGWTLTNTLESTNTTWFASYSESHLTWDALDPLFDGFRQFGPDGEAVAERYELDDTPFRILSLGAHYDPGGWFVMSELARTSSNSIFADSQGWYATGGIRHGRLTPYATVADLRVRSATSDPGVNDPNAAQLNAALNQMLRAFASEQQSIAAGLRWDFAPGFAIKAQLDYIDIGDDSSGVLVNEQPGFTPGRSVTLFSAALDFVF